MSNSGGRRGQLPEPARVSSPPPRVVHTRAQTSPTALCARWTSDPVGTPWFIKAKPRRAGGTPYKFVRDGSLAGGWDAGLLLLPHRKDSTTRLWLGYSFVADRLWLDDLLVDGGLWLDGSLVTRGITTTPRYTINIR